MVEEIERLPWIMIVGACLAGVVVWVIILGTMWISHHHRQTLRYRILEALQREDGLLQFEIAMLARRSGQDQSEVIAALEALILEGLVYRIPMSNRFAPGSIRHRYYLTAKDRTDGFL